MTPNQKKIAIGAGAGIILLLLLSKGNDNSGAQTDPTGNGDVTNPDNTVQAFNSKTIADGLYDAMAGFGTDEEEIMNLLRTVTQTQFGKVVTSFGKRKYNTYTGSTELGSLQPLKVWLKEELATNEYNTLRLKYPNYL